MHFSMEELALKKKNTFHFKTSSGQNNNLFFNNINFSWLLRFTFTLIGIISASQKIPITNKIRDELNPAVCDLNLTLYSSKTSNSANYNNTNESSPNSMQDFLLIL